MEQFGFREKSSTEMTTHNLLNNVLSSLGKKIMLVVYSATYKRLSTVSTSTYSWQKWNFTEFRA
jgi:hypothetical protein